MFIWSIFCSNFHARLRSSHVNIPPCLLSNTWWKSVKTRSVEEIHVCLTGNVSAEWGSEVCFHSSGGEWMSVGQWGSECLQDAMPRVCCIIKHESDAENPLTDWSRTVSGKRSGNCCAVKGWTPRRIQWKEGSSEKDESSEKMDPVKRRIQRKDWSSEKMNPVKRWFQWKDGSSENKDPVKNKSSEKVDPEKWWIQWKDESSEKMDPVKERRLWRVVVLFSS